MVQKDQTKCPKCDGELYYYDSVYRVVKSTGGVKKKILLQRLKCSSCGCTHRVIPNDILPYYRYEREVIQGVLDGLITSSTYGYEDYPCEQTMINWSQKLHSLL